MVLATGSLQRGLLHVSFFVADTFRAMDGDGGGYKLGGRLGVA